MSKADELRRRYDAIRTAMAGTLIGRLATLSPDRRAIYDEWRATCDLYYAERPGGKAYDRMINHGEQPPALRRDVRMILFGPTISVPADATQAEAAESYRRVAMKD